MQTKFYSEPMLDILAEVKEFIRENWKLVRKKSKNDRSQEKEKGMSTFFLNFSNFFGHIDRF